MAAGSNTNSSQSPDSSASAPHSANRRAAAAFIAIGWCAALTWLVFATANPVVLNRQQILAADAVVTVRILDRTAGTCRIRRQWTGDPLPDNLVVARLSETDARGDGEWILPLARDREGLSVLTTRLPSHARLVYPATADALTQLEAILQDQP